MAYQRKFNNLVQRAKQCSCGGKAKLFSRRNYPFGRKSGAKISKFYRCNLCRNISLINKAIGGKR